MALQLPGYQLSIGSASPPKHFTEYDNAGFYKMAESIANAGNNLGNALGGYMQRQREQEGLASMASAMNSGDIGAAAMAAAQSGDREMATKLAMYGLQQKQEANALSQVNSILGSDSGGGSYGGSSVSSNEQGSATPPGGNASYAYKKLQDMGYSPQAAAGIVGNLVQESGVRTNGPSGDNGTAHGLAQWRGERWVGLQNYAKQTGANPNSIDTQLGYLDYELKNKPEYRAALSGVMNAKTAAEAAGAFGLHFERPAGAQTGVAANIDGYGNRVRQANAIFGSGRGNEHGPIASPQAASAPSANAPYQVAGNNWVAPPGGQAQPQQSPNTDAIIAKMQNMGKVLMLPNVPDGVKAGIKAQMDVLNSQLTQANEQYRFSRDQDAKYAFENTQTQHQRETQRLNAELESQKAFDASTGKGSGDQYNSLRTGAESAYNTLGTLSDLKSAMASPDFMSGTGADYVTAAKRLGATVGLDPNKSAPNEVFSAVANKLVLDANNGSLGAGVSNADVGFIKSIKPNTAMTPQAITRLIGIMERNEQGKIDIFNKASDYANTHNGRLDTGWDREMMNARKAQLESRYSNQPTQAPQPGATMDGYQFLGGDPSQKSSWRKL